MDDEEMMKQFFLTAALSIGVAFTFAPEVAEAKRLGGGKSAGMQRSTAPDKPAPQQQNTPPSANPNAQPGAPAAAAAAPKRSWLGPVAGLAAGLGLAALFSHLGLGEELASFVMLALLAVVAFVLIRLVMRRFMTGGAPQPGLAGAAAGAQRAAPPVFVDERPGMQRSALPTVQIGAALREPAASAAPVLPAGFDTEGFERLAKMLFIRMQAANDSADLNDLRNFTTPELFASLRLDLQDRADAAQHTDVQKVEARLVDFAQEGAQQIVSVRFTGLVKEDGAAVTPFDEVWHLVKPADDSRSWAIAGIQQQA